MGVDATGVISRCFQVHITPLPPPIIVSSRRSHLNTNSTNSAPLYSNNSADFFIASPIDNFSSNSTPFDPFDTSYIGQILNDGNDSIIARGRGQPFIAPVPNNSMSEINTQTSLNGFHAQSELFTVSKRLINGRNFN